MTFTLTFQQINPSRFMSIVTGMTFQCVKLRMADGQAKFVVPAPLGRRYPDVSSIVLSTIQYDNALNVGL